MKQKKKKSKKHTEKTVRIILGGLMDLIVGLILLLIDKVI